MSLSTWFRAVGLCGFLIVLASLTGWGQDGGKGKKYALLVGVREYKRSTFPDLKYTENDIEKLAAILEKSGFAKVRVLTNARGKKDTADAPTAANIKKALSELVEDRTRHDTVLVALSGHGAAVQVEDPDDKGKPKTYPFFCPHDADLANISYSTGRSKFLINVNDLFAQLARSGAGVKLVLMDACRNEMKAEGSARSIADTTVNVPKGIGALFSCSAEEKAFESEKLKHGVFFHFVLKGLGGEAARDGAVTFDDLVSYVVGKVSDETPKIMGGGARQTPDRIITYRGKSPVLARLEYTAKEKDRTAKEAIVKEPLKDGKNSIGMAFKSILRGTFQMGSPEKDKPRNKEKKGEESSNEKQHEVTITKDFYLGVYEVTQKQFRQVMGYNPSYFSKDGEGEKGTKYEFTRSLPAGGKDRVKGLDTDNFPVENVSYDEAVKFTAKLNEREKETLGGWKYSLPTEAQWEYACRGGATSYKEYHFGDSITSKLANFGIFWSKDVPNRPQKVGSYKPNAFGLYDMHGNVEEWCLDWFARDYSSAGGSRDPSGPPKGSYRVRRGGSWVNPARECRAAYRSNHKPSFRYSVLGFRVALVPAR